MARYRSLEPDAREYEIREVLARAFAVERLRRRGCFSPLVRSSTAQPLGAGAQWSGFLRRWLEESDR